MWAKIKDWNRRSDACGHEHWLKLALGTSVCTFALILILGLLRGNQFPA
jgi:hypothetical protein